MNLPQAPEGYEAKLPDDFVVPAGLTREQFSFNQTSPDLTAARAWAHKWKLPQQAFHELTGIYHRSSGVSKRPLRRAVRVNWKSWAPLPHSESMH